MGRGRVRSLFAALLVLAVAGMVSISPSPALAQQPRSTTTLEVFPSESQADQPVTFVATVTCTVGTPGGFVTFLDLVGGRRAFIGRAPLSGSPAATATLTFSGLSVGTHTIVARYEGDPPGTGRCPASESSPQTVTVVKRVPHVNLEVSSTNPGAGEPVTLTARVSTGNGPASVAPFQDREPTGTVTFLDGTTRLGTVRLRGSPPTATLTVDDLSVGSHRIVARYNGDSTFEAASSQPVVVTVGQAESTVTLIAPTNPPPHRPITFTAHVSCTAGTPTGTVTFFVDGTRRLGTAPLSGGPTATATLTVGQARLGIGSHTIVARYNGDGTCAAIDSGPIGIVVAPQCLVDVRVLPSNPSADSPVTVFAAVSCVAPQEESTTFQGGASTENVTLQQRTPTGTVTFFDGTTVLGTVPLSGGPTATATLTIESLSPGSHTFRARYNGSGSFEGATAESSVTITVGPAKPRLPVTGVSLPAKPRLPVTGVSLPANLAAGVLLVAAGTALIFASHRRRPARRSTR